MKNPVVGMIAVLSAITLLVGCSQAKSKLDGVWTITSGSQSEGCFSRIHFDKISKTDFITIDEPTENFTQVWFGTYEKEENDIRVTLRDPVADPFMMAVDRNEDELKVQYEWKSKKYVCSYQPEVSSGKY
ncbi:hypothetical protein MUG84_21085 [Paenibacillus sp. KQZ6P-2]|uniref:Uncharacterized protein n=1 Tax=Paenibacillus mangrovi TaxID=2931978 RepID=A0A9X1WUZ0_9BACL|nr:hypothetical protein [Paenibacillus mangrovi]MCJ8014210.1 hypothetical protein [Paenibacillus mangrovi]